LNIILKKESVFVSVIGYGTFITQKLWKGKPNVEVCLVKHFSRIQPPNNWFPYAIPSDKSLWALKFDVQVEELDELDRYEGLPQNLFERKEIYIILKSGKQIPAFIYLPTPTTTVTQKLTLDLDLHDRWKEEIKKYPEIVEKFPELIM
jgi:hypothetical protein